MEAREFSEDLLELPAASHETSLNVNSYVNTTDLNTHGVPKSETLQRHSKISARGR